MSTLKMLDTKDSNLQVKFYQVVEPLKGRAVQGVCLAANDSQHLQFLQTFDGRRRYTVHGVHLKKHNYPVTVTALRTYTLKRQIRRSNTPSKQRKEKVKYITDASYTCKTMSKKKIQ